MSEEFGGALPSVIWAERQRLPAGFLEQVIEYRNYARVKAMVDAADTAEARKRLPSSPLVELVKTIEFELARQEIDGNGG